MNINEKSEKEKNNDELEKLLGEIIEEFEECEREIDKLTKKQDKTKAEEKELKKLQDGCELMLETIHKAEDHLIFQYGGPKALLDVVKHQAAMGDKQAQEDLKIMEPVIHQYLLDETEKN